MSSDCLAHRRWQFTVRLSDDMYLKGSGLAITKCLAIREDLFHRALGGYAANITVTLAYSRQCVRVDFRCPTAFSGTNHKLFWIHGFPVEPAYRRTASEPLRKTPPKDSLKNSQASRRCCPKLGLGAPGICRRVKAKDWPPIAIDCGHCARDV